ncbi:MAG TPA: DUF1501 domain-containing protein [Gemmatimonadaceae bacterium]|nr:DUF1501 domain-containing protein [Gemmatimonadaceae bacterium]
MHNCKDEGCTEYNELSRRQFITWSAGAAFLATVIPPWLPKIVLAESYASNRDVIISIFLRGGADGLSLCAPFYDVEYYNGRPTIAIPRPDSTAANKGIALDDKFMFPQAMSSLVEPFTNKDLLVVHGTGSVDTTRSHFDAQRFMEVGKPRDPSIITGWLGRHLASSTPVRTNAPLRALGIANGLAKTLVGAPQTLPIPNPASFSLGGSATTRQARTDWLKADYLNTPDPVKSAAVDAVATVDLLKVINFTGYAPANGAVYPTTSFGTSLRSAAALIKADIGVEAVQVDIGGWDTHSAQDPLAGSMFTTMTQFSTAIAALYKDLVAGAQTQNVTVVIVSEFGRNVRENGSKGTDHGRGNAMFVMGKNIAGGRVMTQNFASLARENLESGQDLKVTIDHRDVLAEVVKNRLSNNLLSFVFPDFVPNFRGVTR